jgi:LmbE family N-acetylglucosaminyl deacetylase
VITTRVAPSPAPLGQPIIDVTGGTSESAWRDSSLLAARAPFPLESIERAVVVAPHPDDEILACGATLARLAGIELVLVAVTDGEAARPDADPAARAALADRRAAESALAARRLGVTFARITRLGLPDGGVTALEDELTAALERELDDTTWCFAPWTLDGHPDHDASGRAAHRAANPAAAHVVEFPVWAWNWCHPDDGRLPLDRARYVELDPALAAAKADAVAAFTSQLDRGPDGSGPPVLPAGVLAHFARPFETFLLP